MAKLVVIEDDVIKSLLRNPQAVGAFPFMKAAAERETPKKKRGCNCGAKNRQNASTYAGIKAAIAGMPPEKKAQLKQILGADQLRVYYTNHKKQTVKLTF